jgi:uncharacterized protein YbbC (DUF1343 family)
MIRSIGFITFLLVLHSACATSGGAEQADITVGAEQLGAYLPLLQGQRVGLVVNHTSRAFDRHLVDVLRDKNVNITAIFAPEHGFRGTADAGESVKGGKDAQTGLPVFSLYGKTKKPTPEMMAQVDVLVFDMQDVGTRFFTYISTMHYAMEACADTGKKMIVLDRPNPNGHYVDGPVLDTAFRSFVGMHPIPVVHGLTVGELAHMINAEGWLAGEVHCQLTVVPVENYTHSTHYTLPVKPSPNLPNAQAVQLYPTLCFFEGTAMSVGRGTEFPFQVLGFPAAFMGDFTFVPQPIDGMDKNPKHKGQTCYGVDLRQAPAPASIQLHYLIDMYGRWKLEEDFFNSYFNTLAGTDQLMHQIKASMDETAIRASWEPALSAYKKMRVKYLLYPDFEEKTAPKP